MTLVATHPVVEQCPTPVDGKCPGHTPADAEYRPDFPPRDPEGPVVAKMEELTTSGRMICETIFRRAMALEAERDALRDELAQLKAERGV